MPLNISWTGHFGSYVNCHVPSFTLPDSDASQHITTATISLQTKKCCREAIQKLWSKPFFAFNLYLLSLNKAFRGTVWRPEVTSPTAAPSTAVLWQLHGRPSPGRFGCAWRRDVMFELTRLVSARRLVDVAGSAMRWRSALEIGRMASNPVDVWSVCVTTTTLSNGEINTFVGWWLGGSIEY